MIDDGIIRMRAPRDYSITVKVLNNRLLEKMRAAGCETAAELSRACKVSNSEISLYLRMRKAPMIYDGQKWSAPVLRMAEYLRCLPEDLFPPAQIRLPLQKNTAEFKADASDIQQISASLRSLALPSDEKMMIAESKKALDELLGTLTTRERNIIDQRFGLIDGEVKTLAAIEGENVSRDRVRQIEASALRKLKARAKDNKTLMEAIGA